MEIQQILAGQKQDIQISSLLISLLNFNVDTKLLLETINNLHKNKFKKGAQFFQIRFENIFIAVMFW